MMKRIYLLTGMPGTGKTTILREALSRNEKGAGGGGKGILIQKGSSVRSGRNSIVVEWLCEPDPVVSRVIFRFLLTFESVSYNMGSILDGPAKYK